MSIKITTSDAEILACLPVPLDPATAADGD